MAHHLNNIHSSIKKYKMNSLFVKNFFIIFLVVMLPLDCISLIDYANNAKLTQQEIYQSNYNLTATVSGVTDNLMKEIQSFTLHTAAKHELLTYLLNTPLPGLNNFGQEALIEYTKNYTYVLQYIQSIYVYCDSTNVVLADYVTSDFNTFADNNWYDAYADMTQDETVILMRAQGGRYPYFLTFIQPIFATDVDKIGALIVNVNTQKLGQVLQGLDTNSTSQQIYILADDGRVIYSDQQKELMKNISEIPLLSDFQQSEKNDTGTLKLDGKAYVYARVDSQKFDWSYYTILPMDSYNDRLKRTSTLLLALLLTSTVISIIGSIYISLRAFQPIDSILDLINPFEDDSQKLFTDAPKNESTYILNKIERTLQTNKELTEELNARLMLLQHAQITALQSQINPHFLYNTLDTINWMAIEDLDGENRISDALTILADLFKSNIDTTNYLTDLKQELDYTMQYTEILRIRYHDLFEMHWQIDKDIQNAKLPRLTLQPLIENALYHGIKPKGEKGIIDVTIKKIELKLIITVTDDGVGMTPAQLQAIQNLLSQNLTAHSKHIGLQNINQRIKLIYGEAGNLSIKSVPGQTSIRLEMEFVN